MDKDKNRIRENVYVIGAGFSAGLGYPITSKLLSSVWERLSVINRERLHKIICFHFPKFDPNDEYSFPNIERLLTLMKVNEDLFHASREVEGNFRKEEIEEIIEILLCEISSWFHELYNDLSNIQWLDKFIERVKNERAGIVSFNWDLVLDYQLFENDNLPVGYGLIGKFGDNDEPILLKPHGSLNWYERGSIENVKKHSRLNIFKDKNTDNSVDAFIYPREITSKVGNRYTPLIVPPMYLKDFNKNVFRRLWQRTTDLLSTAKNIYILGYSLPADDLHTRFIFRCAFHNQREGRLKGSGKRYPATGNSNIYIVNPSNDIKARYQDIIDSDANVVFIPKKVEDWILDDVVINEKNIVG
ncbi:MAG: hypothetical protein SVR94_04960 [Pseudomonadota bacterium]|nr:hypothetical protein [Pseudomonadota bacterium]